MPLFLVNTTISRGGLFSVTRNPLLDFHTSQNIGHIGGVCIYTVARDAQGNYELECDMTFVLDNGTFVVKVRPVMDSLLQC